MSRAEERALEAYPYDYPERTGFRQGYEQAEKDLALTVEDIKTILDISFWNDDPEKILEEYNRICDTLNQTRR